MKGKGKRSENTTLYIKGLKGHNGIKQRNIDFMKLLHCMETEFSSKSSKSGMGLSGMDTPFVFFFRFYYILALIKCSHNHPPTEAREKNLACVKKIDSPPPRKNYLDNPLQ